MSGTSIGRVQIALEAVDNASGVMNQIKGSISGLSGVATTLGQNMGAVGNIIGDLGGPFKGVGDIISGFAAGGPAGAGIAMIGQAVGFLQGSVKAAEDSERVMALLRTTVENQGTAWGTVKDRIDETLQSMQATTRFSDEELAQALATLVQHGMDVNEAMKALPTVMDAAVGSGKPLSDIATAVGKAFEGADGALTRLVPAIGDLDKNMGAGATSGDKFQAALGLLNDRFGGTAAADAETYAGVQERMGNAWDQFQEDIGNVLLPALTDLMTGLMKIGTEAIGPLMDSLGELWSALFGDDVNLKDFGKFILDSVIAVLKGLASFIKEDVVPTVKMIHEAFQTASEVIGPPLKIICDAVSGFIKTLTDAFQGFYNWLVGGSLWSDMWNQMLTAASELIGRLLSDLGTKLFEPMKTAFTSAIDTLKDLWSKGWDAMQTAATTIWDAVTKDVGPWIDGVKTSIGTTMDGLKTAWDTTWDGVKTSAQTVWDTMKTNAGTWIEGVKTTISNTQDSLKTVWDTNWGAVKTTLETKMGETQTSLNTALDGLKSALSTSTGTYGPTMTSAVSGMQGAMNAGFLLVKGDWQGALDAISGSLTSWGDAAKGIMDGIMNGLQGAVKVGLDTIKGGWDTFVGALQGGVGTLQSALDSAGGSVQQALDAVGAATTPATSTVTSAFTSAFNTISTAATNFWNWLTGHSLWPDMLDLMSGVTRDKLLDIAGTFNKVFASIDQELSTRFQNMSEGTKGAMGMILQVIAGSLAEIQNNFMSTMIDVQNSWSDAWTEINRVAATTTQQIFDGLTAWYQLIQGATIQSLAVLGGAFGAGLNSIYGMFSGTFSNMVVTAQSSMAAIVSTIISALAQVQAAAAQMKNQMVTGSIWTSMLDEMQAQTVSALGNIVGDFKDMSLAIPAAAVPYPSMQPMTSQRSRSEMSPLIAPSRPTEITTTIPVTIDGELLYKIVNKKLIEHHMGRRLL